MEFRVTGNIDVGRRRPQPFFLKNPASRPVDIRYQVSGSRYQISGIGIRYQVLESGIGIPAGIPVGIPKCLNPRPILTAVFLPVGLWGLPVKGLNNKEILNRQPYFLVC